MSDIIFIDVNDDESNAADLLTIEQFLGEQNVDGNNELFTASLNGRVNEVKA